MNGPPLIRNARVITATDDVLFIVDAPAWHGREGMGRFVPRGEVRVF